MAGFYKLSSLVGKLLNESYCNNANCAESAAWAISYYIAGYFRSILILWFLVSTNCIHKIKILYG